MASGLTQRCSTTQYHALGLLCHVRKNGRLAVSKMISKFTRHGLKSPFAYCMMIRVASSWRTRTAGSDAPRPPHTPSPRPAPRRPQRPLAACRCSRDSPLFDFIESCLRNKHEMVVYEAASAIVSLPGCSARLAPAVSGAQARPRPPRYAGSPRVRPCLGWTGALSSFGEAMPVGE